MQPSDVPALTVTERASAIGPRSSITPAAEDLSDHNQGSVERPSYGHLRSPHGNRSCHHRVIRESMRKGLAPHAGWEGATLPGVADRAGQGRPQRVGGPASAAQVCRGEGCMNERRCRNLRARRSLCAIVAAVTLAACAATNDSVAMRSYFPQKVPGSTVYSDDRNPFPLAAGALDSRGRLLVTVFGSSTCPDMPTELHAEAPSNVRIEFVENERGDCTADLAPRTHVFELPEQVTTDAPLTVRLGSPGFRSLGSESETLTLRVVPHVNKRYTY